MPVWGRLGVRELQRRPELGEERAGPRSGRSIAGAEVVAEEQRRPEVWEEDVAVAGQIHPVPRSEKAAPAWIRQASTAPAVAVSWSCEIRLRGERRRRAGAAAAWRRGVAAGRRRRGGGWPAAAWRRRAAGWRL